MILGFITLINYQGEIPCLIPWGKHDATLRSSIFRFLFQNTSNKTCVPCVEHNSIQVKLLMSIVRSPLNICQQNVIHTSFAGIKALGPDARDRGTSTPCS